MPEWCEEGLDDGETVEVDGVEYDKPPITLDEMNSGLAALRADRDYWRDGYWEEHDRADAQTVRIRELETERDSWMQKCHSESCRVQELEQRLAALTKPKPADDWRERCVVNCNSAWLWYIMSPSKRWSWSDAIGWTKGCPKYFGSQTLARAVLADIPTPPPDAAEGATQ